jgi:hypothetical protein
VKPQGVRTFILAAAAASVLGACDDKGSSVSPTSKPPAATAAAAAAPAATAAAAPTPAKTYDCGAKDQKPCPMQGWMKRVMAPASVNEDGEALAKALTYVSEHVPPGFTEWSSIASAGASKAKSGDIDGAKSSCKQCHDAYKDKYKSTMRDRAF